MWWNKPKRFYELIPRIQAHEFQQHSVKFKRTIANVQYGQKNQFLQCTAAAHDLDIVVLGHVQKSDRSRNSFSV
jgi:hypothetical protein